MNAEKDCNESPVKDAEDAVEVMGSAKAAESGGVDRSPLLKKYPFLRAAPILGTDRVSCRIKWVVLLRVGRACVVSHARPSPCPRRPL